MEGKQPLNELPVREMVLYKHGVGFFVREGDVEGEEIELIFRQDEINDVLKSLAVFDKAGGQVLGIHYQTPMDRQARLKNTSIRLDDSASLRNLIRDLRGRQATLKFEVTPGTLETITGRIVGLDEFPKEAFNPPPTLITILTDDNQVRTLTLESLRSVDILDKQSERDLRYFLDTGMSEDTRRRVSVQLSKGKHQLSVFYVAPSPTWRVSYRVVAESDKKDDSEIAETGKLLLQGWGLFDNRLEEDLENVRVTLVAGQPISFIYDLYASRIPKRPMVRDESRIAPGPVEFEGAMLNDKAVMAEKALEAKERATWGRRAKARGGAVDDDRFMATGTVISPQTIADAAPAQATGKAAGEFFQYAVTTPVSVKRGESALVPIIGKEVHYNRELLYNGSKLPDHPVVALRFNNTTELTLERGPVTVVEDGDYKGEAVVAFTKEDNEVYLPYAVELGVKVTEKMKTRRETVSIRIDKGYVVYDEYFSQTVMYTLENTTAKNLTVLIEAPVRVNWTLYGTPVPDVETARERRWKVEVPARKSMDFVRTERESLGRREKIYSLTYQKISEFLKKKWIDDALYGKLGEILAVQESIQKMQKEEKQLSEEQDTLYKQQEQLRANLNALQPTGQEASLRNRMLKNLEDSQNRLDEIQGRVKELQQAIPAEQKRMEEMIKQL